MLAALTLLTTLLAALPSTTKAAPTTSTTPSQFYLVSTTSKQRVQNTTTLPSAAVLGFFDPYYQPAYLLRPLEPGYGSAPTFALTDGTLQAPSSGPHGIGNFVYSSAALAEGQQLRFFADGEGGGDLSVRRGHLLAVGGSVEGWTLCTGPLGLSVIEYKGTDVRCTPTYIQVVTTPPY